MIRRSIRRRPVHADRDSGSALILVLVLMLVGSLVVLPMMSYAVTVTRAATVPADKASAVSMAKGGIWVALEHQSDLYDLCVGGAIPSSLDGVDVSCEVLDTETLRPAAEVPYRVAVVQADETVPVQVADPDDYPNPNTASVPGGWDAWLDGPDWTATPTAGSVWLPELPVRATSGGGARDTTMLPGTQDPLYASCRVFFPGTFTDPITLDGPTYFTSGVYYFTDQITIENGADVVVGNGEAGGCTTDFEAVASATSVPDPLNMSGLGGTFVLGESGRIVLDDTAGTGDIRFAINQRYVSIDETSVAASSDVSIVSVNGSHAPFAPGEALGDDLVVDGTIAVPASTVGVDGSPAASDSDYLPSVLTPKATEPDAPRNVQAVAAQNATSTAADRGRLTVTWDVPNDNGSLITAYTATESLFGNTCTAAVPAASGLPAQASCTIEGLTHRGPSDPWYTVTVVATNSLGDSVPSVPSSPTRVDLAGSIQSAPLALPEAPATTAVGTSHTDGLRIDWTPPTDDGGTPITSYRVDATHVIDGSVVSCSSWWDETSCLLPVAGGLTAGSAYDISVVAVTGFGESAPAPVDGDEIDVLPPEPDPTVFVPGTSTSTVRVPAVATTRVPAPIVEFVSETNSRVTIDIAGLIATPQGRIEVGAAVPGRSNVSMTGGVVAAQFWVDPGGTPAYLDISFDNPVAQKRIRINATADVGGFEAKSQAVARINRSGSLKIASWYTQ